MTKKYDKLQKRKNEEKEILLRIQVDEDPNANSPLKAYVQ
jgi:hypothetical protein